MMTQIEKLSPDEFEKEFLAILSKDTGYSISTKDTFAGLDLDSMDMFELLLIIEERFCMTLPDDFATFLKLSDTFNSVIEKLKPLYYC